METYLGVLRKWLSVRGKNDAPGAAVFEREVRKKLELALDHCLRMRAERVALSVRRCPEGRGVFRVEVRVEDGALLRECDAAVRELADREQREDEQLYQAYAQAALRPDCERLRREALARRGAQRKAGFERVNDRLCAALFEGAPPQAPFSDVLPAARAGERAGAAEDGRCLLFAYSVTLRREGEAADETTGALLRLAAQWCREACAGRGEVSEEPDGFRVLICKNP